MDTRYAIGSGTLVALLLSLAGCGGGLRTMGSYESLKPALDEKGKPRQGRDACGMEANERGDSSSAYAIGGWALGATTVGLAAAPAILATKDEIPKSDRYIAPALLVGSVVTGALTYVLFDRSDAHAQAAATSQLAVKTTNDKDTEAYATCVEARSLVYSSRKESNQLATSKLLEQQGKQTIINANYASWHAAKIRETADYTAVQTARKNDDDAQSELTKALGAATAAPADSNLKARLAAAQASKEATALALTQATERLAASRAALEKAAAAIPDPK